MTRLTDKQLTILSAATQRDDHVAEITADPATKKVVAGLLKRKLLQEVAAAQGMPVWRRDDDLGQRALVITSAGLEAICVSPDEEPQDEIAGPASRQRRQDAGDEPVLVSDRPRAGTKLALVVDLLERADGASIDNLITATAWLPHTTRAALTGLRKRGYAITADRKDGTTVYRSGPAERLVASPEC